MSRYDPTVASSAVEGETGLIAALRAGDESAFTALVDLHTPTMLRVARGYVSTHELAEEVVQETWIAVLRGIDRFEGRSALRTWLFTIMVNIAKARGLKERRHADLQVLAASGGTVDPARFREAGDRWPGHWKEHEAPVPFPDTPEGSVLGEELMTVARRELDKLPPRQREVVMMRDVLGLESAEVCDLLEISAANQRVLLHRGRAAVRQALEDYLKEKA
ncbi:RNA polymerase sigma24 factor [Mycobacterium sp. SWH-M3]|nr:RNA polymerase sigma24 factor [Mycobacterium sp. SWH-M3]